MNIDWVIPCRYLEVHDGLGTLVGAGIDTYWIPELPTAVQVLLAIRLLGTADELDPDEEHTTTNRVRNPQGEVISELGGPFSVGVESPNPDWLTGFIVPLAMQFEVTEEGAYQIEIEVDQASTSLPIHVIHGLPPGMDPPEA